MNIWVDVNGWPFPPSVLLGCFAAEFLYFRGWLLLVKEVQNGPEGTSAGTTPFPAFVGVDIGKYQGSTWRWRGSLFLAAIIMMLVASSAPVDLFSARFFWVHMIQHLFLLVVMAPLFVLGAPWLPWWLGLPVWGRRFILACAKRRKIARPFALLGRVLQQPVVVLVLLLVGVWAWHWPSLYDFALTNDLVHDWLEHSCFMAVSLLFWVLVIPSPPIPMRLGYVARMGCIGIAMIQNVVLAVLLGFAQAPLYAPYARLAALLGGLPALQDQQLGAGIMWTFGDLPFAITISVIVQQWLAAHEDDPGVALEAPGSVKADLVSGDARGATP